VSDAGDLPVGYTGAHHIGSGGWAEVFRCTGPDGTQVALKLFHQRLDDPVAGSEGFRNECEIAARLSVHPGVINLRAAGITAAGRPWLAMDYAPNGTLADLIERSGGTLPLEQALDIAVALADTLEWAHRVVIHGDLKTANVLLDAQMRPLLSDFGVATHIGPRHSVTVRQFTQTHAAPEVLKYGRGSIASDVWALTATLYEMLTGEPPFLMRADEGPGTFIDRVQQGLPEEAIPDWIPVVLGQALRFGLTVDPDIRTANMAEAAVLLRTVQSGLDLPLTQPVPMPDLPADGQGIPFVDYAEASAPAAAPPASVAASAPVPEPPAEPTADLAPAIAAFTAGSAGGAGAEPPGTIRPFEPPPDGSFAPPSVRVAPSPPPSSGRFRRSEIAAAVAVLAVILTIAGIILAQTGANGHGTAPSTAPSTTPSATVQAAPPPTSGQPTLTPSPSAAPSRSPRHSPTHHPTHSRTPTPTTSSPSPSASSPSPSGSSSS
jgi:serine/threonine protein kinase